MTEESDVPAPAPPADVDGSDVSDGGIVRYVTAAVRVTGYSPSEFNNIANRNHLAIGLARYLNITAGDDGVFVLDVEAGRRRKLLSSSSLVRIQVLLTVRDSSTSVVTKLDTTNGATATALQNAMVAVLPRISAVQVNDVGISSTANIGAFTPPDREDQDVKQFGGAFIAVAILIVFFAPFLALVVGLVAGPTSRVGRVVMVFVGEEKYLKLQSACCGSRPASDAPQGAPQHATKGKKFFFMGK